jgi:hypothetical protein
VCHTKSMKKETTYCPAAVSGIYEALELLLPVREEIHAWWVGLLYLPDGEVNYSEWSERTLALLWNDVALYV